jgi:hypothetical protein
MTTPAKKPDSLERSSESKEVDRYDLTGFEIRNWTELARQKLAVIFDTAAQKTKEAATAPLEGSEGSLSDALRRAPGKLISHAESALDKGSIENKLLLAQVETEYTKAQLTLQQMRKTAAEAHALELANEERQIEIVHRLLELSDGRTNLELENLDGDPAVIFANLRIDHEQ